MKAPVLRIAIVVPGRFHAFDLAKGLIRRGHDVVVLTNYPKWAAQRFGLPRDRVWSFWLHGLLSRMADGMQNQWGYQGLEPFLHRLFGEWSWRCLRKKEWDVVHPWSGIGEEVSIRAQKTLRLLMRGSAHIRTQSRLLREEQARVGRRIDQPSPWMIEREEREYLLADKIIVLSTFARDTFLREGVPADKLWVLPLGADVRMFRPPPEALEERIRRITAGEPLRILYVGALSFRKGLWDLGSLARSLSPEEFRIRAVGPASAETRGFLRGFKDRMKIEPKVPQRHLAAVYRWADLFVFPTIEDGFAVVLAQAQAAGLPILTTVHCSGPDLVEEGRTGWIFPIRDPAGMAERLRWCQSHRNEMVEMVRRIYYVHKTRDWDDVSKNFESMICAALKP